MKHEEKGNTNLVAIPWEGLLGWLRGRMQSTRRAPARLALLERITLAPRQSLALVEAEGRRFLVATSPEGGPALYALDKRAGTSTSVRSAGPVRPVARASW